MDIDAHGTNRIMSIIDQSNHAIAPMANPEQPRLGVRGEKGSDSGLGIESWGQGWGLVFESGFGYGLGLGLGLRLRLGLGLGFESGFGYGCFIGSTHQDV